ncbi:SPFH domain-containing protein [Chryseobacterium oryzae]|uniref:SPFH domain-containing protein n=1 Tax=Chryseobacterium oryzae TaxID=2929799 RepID=A0ABY4BJY8_9FLAO|nr:SPFH domain-containing protein [Chryseobacterium oryzae]UOE39189.1 SPFH domain-containing protein [Chryseobacterium oryzae]
MGLFDRLKQEFIDIIEWTDNSQNTIVWKFPRFNNEIKMNAKLTVRESQQAVFFNEGTIADVFNPGMYTLQTQNMPILATLKGWKYGFESPFKADVFFVNTKQFIDQKWGTKNAIVLNDDRFGMIELRSFGTFAFKVIDAGKFIKEIAGTNDTYETEDVIGQLKSIIVTKFSSAIGDGSIPIDKFAANLEDLSRICQTKLNDEFAGYGLEITKFLIENVSMPEDLKKEIFEYSRLNKLDMQKLSQFKAAQSIEIAAANEGGLAGIGAGIGVGNAMAGVFTQNQTSSAVQSAPPPLPSSAQYFVAVNGQQTGPFTIEQLLPLVQNGSLSATTQVWKNGMANWDSANSLDELKNLFANTPPPLHN